MDTEDVALKAKALLRRAGLASVPSPVLIGVALLACALVCVGVWHFWPRSHDEFAVASTNQVQVEASTSSSASSVSSSAVPTTVLVDVEGAVVSPGLYELAEGARVGDAVSAAGGMAADAVSAQVNLARKLEDGEQVYIPSAGEMSTAQGNTGELAAGTSPGQKTGASSAASDKVNINTATSEELQKLSGIGPSLAERIIEYRESNGRFSTVEDLQNVSGSGKTRFAKIKDKICA